MKRYLLLLSFSFASILSSSQTDKFDLSKYKLPDIKRQQLDFFFQSSGQNSSSKYFTKDEMLVIQLKMKIISLVAHII